MRAPFKLHPLFSSILLITLITAGFNFAHADDYQDVNRLLRAKQLPEALAKADQLLVTKPRDPQLRFMKGVIQNEMGRINEATTTFTRLTEDHPELPEPYNNLAVIYATTGQFDKARTALEAAIRTNPSYATAHENLGDIYVKLASQSYAKALQLDATSVSAIQPKLALIRDLFTPTPGKAPAPSPTVPSTTVSSTTVSSSPAAAPPAAPTPVVAALQTKVPTIVTASPTGSTQPSVAPPIVANAIVNREIEAAITSWVQAWNERDMKGYIGSYTKDFVPASKQSNAQWQEERKSRLMGTASIRVKLSNLSIKVNGDIATVTFHQNYKVNSRVSNTRKTLELVRSGDIWLISKEMAA